MKRILVIGKGEEARKWVSLLRKSGFSAFSLPEEDALGVVLRGDTFDFLLLPADIARLVSLFLEGVPAAVWVVSKERKILIQNRVAEVEWGTKLGEYCFLAIHKGKALPEAERKEALAGRVRPGMQCVFCHADEALERQRPVRCEIEWEGRFWDVFWIPLGKDVYLHYAHDVTLYRKMVEEFRTLATIDSLTGIYNRRYFFEALCRECERIARGGGKLSLALFDLDGFKMVNDSLGHDVGDKVLAEIAQAIQGVIRRGDIFARYGGDEFAVLFPDTGVLEAQSVVLRIRDHILRVGYRCGVPLDASFGMGEYIPGEGVEAFLRRVDAALYQAKRRREKDFS